MLLLQTNQIVTTVVGWAEHDAVLRRGKNLCSLRESRRGHSRTVGVDQADRSKADREQILRGKNEPLTEITLTLRDELKILRKDLAIRFLGADRRVAANPARVCTHPGDRGGDIAQEANIQRGRFPR